jgi:hypothetical protein
MILTGEEDLAAQIVADWIVRHDTTGATDPGDTDLASDLRAQGLGEEAIRRFLGI